MEELPLAESPVRPWMDRVFSALVILTGGFFVVILALVPPDPRGYGTHELLGMAPCSWPSGGGVPCPTCGVTTAACHLVHLSPLKAVATHPFGAALAASGIWLMLAAGICLIRGTSFVDKLSRLPYATLLLSAGALLLGSWAYKFLIFA